MVDSDRLRNYKSLEKKGWALRVLSHTNRLIKTIATAALLLLGLGGLLGCDPAYPIYIKNDLSEPVIVDARFSGGDTYRGPLPPQKRLIYVGIPGKMTSLIVTHDGTNLGTFDREALCELINTRRRPVLLTVQAGGMYPSNP